MTTSLKNLHLSKKIIRLIVIFGFLIALILVLLFIKFFKSNNQDVRNKAAEIPYEASTDTLEDNSEGWVLKCSSYTDGLPKIDCPSDYLVNENNSLLFNGTNNIQSSFVKNLAVKENSIYKVKVTLKFSERHVFNFADVSPKFPTAIYNVSGIDGIWSGVYNIYVNGTDNDNNFLPEDFPLAGQRASSDVDWFTETSYIQTKPGQTSTNISILLKAFWGKMYVDNVRLDKVDSYIEDKYIINNPIKTEFQGMKIQEVTSNPWIIKTNAAKFVLTDNTITQYKGNDLVSKITYEDNSFLKNLERVENSNTLGNVVLRNENILMSIGADSVLLSKLKKDINLKLEGPKPKYYNYEAGVLFTTDYEKGGLFSPLRPKTAIQSMPQVVSEANLSRTYPDNLFVDNNLPYFWTPQSVAVNEFKKENWQISYKFNSGEGFASEIFPPKDFDTAKYCSNRMDRTSLNTLGDSADFSYAFQKFKDHNNIAFVYLNEYGESKNTSLPAPPTSYCTDTSGKIVSCSTPGSKSKPIDYKTSIFGGIFEVASPENKAKFTNFVNEAHKSGLRVIIYVTPAYYYTSDIDKFLKNTESLLKEFNLDGVYYDGSYEGDMLKNVELGRKTRDMLERIRVTQKRKEPLYYTQHKSWTGGAIRRTDKFRVPSDTNFADLTWLGEHVKAVDTPEYPVWNINYCSKNISNTPSTLLSEHRPVNYTNINDEASYEQRKEQNKSMNLTPQKQIQNSLACNGNFRVDQYNKVASIDDEHFGNKVDYDADIYWDAYDAKCKQFTCGNNKCEPGESIKTCQRDCAPKKTDISPKQTKLNNTYTCKVDNTNPAQWLLKKDGTNEKDPFYSMHFTFDSDIATEYSGNKLTPSHIVGRGIYNKPVKKSEFPNALYFDSQMSVFGEYDEKLDLSGKSFSVMMKIKKDSDRSSEQPIFTLNPQSSFYIGISTSNKPFVAGIDKSTNEEKRIFGKNQILVDSWNTIIVTYDASSDNVKLYLNGELDQESTVEFTNFKGTFPNIGEYVIGGKGRNGQYKGYIDDLGVTDFVLTTQQVGQYHENSFKTLTIERDAECIVQKDTTLLTAITETLPTETPTPSPSPSLSPTPVSNKAKGDLNGDNYVSEGDLSLLGSQWCPQKNIPSPKPCGSKAYLGDVNGDNIVDTVDLGTLAYNWKKRF